MERRGRYPDEVKERAVRLVFEQARPQWLHQLTEVVGGYYQSGGLPGRSRYRNRNTPSLFRFA
jgi:hypothetical protein